MAQKKCSERSRQQFFARGSLRPLRVFARFAFEGLVLRATEKIKTAKFAKIDRKGLKEPRYFSTRMKSPLEAFTATLSL